VIKKKQCNEDAENWLLTAPEGHCWLQKHITKT